MADEPEDEDFFERFLEANANPEFIAHHFADVLRNLMRAVAANDPADATFRAAERMGLVAQLISKSSQRISFYELFELATKDIRRGRDHSPAGRAMTRAAASGLKYLVERSCHDNAALGRASKRADDFLRHIRDIEHARARERRLWDEA